MRELDSLSSHLQDARQRFLELDLSHDRLQNQWLHRRQARHRQQLLATTSRGKRDTTFDHPMAGQGTVPRVCHFGAQFRQFITGMEVMPAIRKGQLRIAEDEPQTPTEQFYALTA